MADFPGEIITILFAEDEMPAEIVSLILDGDMVGEQVRLCQVDD